MQPQIDATIGGQLSGFAQSDESLARKYDPQLIRQLSDVMDIIECRRQPHKGMEGEKWMARGAFLKRALDLAGDGGERLTLTFPGFPCKSPNDETKVLGAHPDMAERLAIQNLAKMMTDINQVYAGGAELLIASDGLPFNPLFNIPDSVVDKYLLELRDLAKGTHIRFQSMLEMMPEAHGDVEAARAILLRDFAPSESALLEKIKNDRDLNQLYTGLKFFLIGDMEPQWRHQQGVEKLSRSQGDKLSGLLAKEFLVRNEAYNMVVAQRLPPCIRLSCHPQYGDNPNKVGIDLIFSESKYAWATPWHNAMVLRMNGDWDVTRKKQALDAGCVIINDELGRPSHLSERGY